MSHSKSLSDTEIKHLISVKKVIDTIPKKSFYPDKQTNKVLRNDFTCHSEENPNDKFCVFIRKNTIIIDQFSIGLRYMPKDLLLIRVNGNQQHRNSDKSFFMDFHIHTATEKQLQQGIFQDYDAVPCHDYCNFNSALLHFGKICGIINIIDYFPSINQISFLED